MKLVAAFVGIWAAAFGWAAAPSQETKGERTVWDGVYTEEQAKRGADVYKQQCVRCHGETLEGNGEGAGPLTGIVFMSMWNGLTLGDLFDRLRLTMPQDKPGTLSRENGADVIAYVLNFNRFPAGKTELAREAERLRQIRFEATKR